MKETFIMKKQKRGAMLILLYLFGLIQLELLSATYVITARPIDFWSMIYRGAINFGAKLKWWVCGYVP